LNKHLPNEKEKINAQVIRKLRKGEEKEHFEMLNLCFSPWGSEKEWKRLYVRYPGFDVTKNVIIVEESGEWAGGGTAWFREAFLKNGDQIKVYEAGDLYVHQNHRGKGIYSTAMRTLNELARKRGAVLGFAFPSIYRIPRIALPKYGFVEVFSPITKVLVLNPESFFQFLFDRVERGYLPARFDSIKFTLTLSFQHLKGKYTVSKTFEVNKGVIQESTNLSSMKNVDLKIETDAYVLLRVSSSLYLGKRTLLHALITALLLRRLKFRFSFRFLRMLLGYMLD